MKHLTAKEIAGFTAMERLSPETLRLASMVNSHILRCDACLEQVRNALRMYENIRRSRGEIVMETEMER